MTKIAITTTSFGKMDSSPLDLCQNQFDEVVLNPHGRKLESEEILEVVGDSIGMIAGTEKLSREVLEKLPKLKVISRLGAGIDNVDLDAAKELGIQVFNTPFGPTRSVAELGVGLILDVLRGISRADRELRNGVWKKRMGNLLQDKKVGIIGFGRIGQETARLLLAFGVEVSYFDINQIDSDLTAKPKTLEELLKWADIITIHVSSSKPIIGETEMGLLKPTAILVNLARGGAVDEKSLIIALKENKIGGAALDVFEAEPYTGVFNEFENVVLTPHIGSYALEGRVAMEIQSVENLIEGLDNI